MSTLVPKVPEQHTVEVPVDRYVEKIIEKLVEVPVDRFVEKIVKVPEVTTREVPVERIVEKIVQVMPPHKPILEPPCPHVRHRGV